MRQVVSRHLTVGVKRAAAELAREWRVMRRHRAGVRKLRRLSIEPGNLKLNLGCGPNPRPGWLNIDLFNPVADVSLDFREPLPLPDNSAMLAYSEHLLEHLSYPRDAHHFLCECFRVLAPGGRLSLVVPDGGAFAEAYARGDASTFELRRLRSYLREERVTLMHHLNYVFRADGLHQYAYDEETLRNVLQDIGFDGVIRRTYDPALDSAKRNLPASLYLEATKPVTSE